MFVVGWRHKVDGCRSVRHRDPVEAVTNFTQWRRQYPAAEVRYRIRRVTERRT
jgi:hypothetical protein